MLTLNIIHPILLTEENCPTEYGGFPIYRKSAQLGLTQTPKIKTYILHPIGLKLHYIAEKGFLAICTENGCMKAGSMIDIRCKNHARSYSRCQFINCNKSPYYGYEYRKALTCREHFIEGMIDVKHIKCEVPGCNTRPNFGFKDGRATRCKSHIVENMGNVNSKQCEHDSCTKQPCYGFVGSIPSRCKAHKNDNMVNITSRKCEAEGCATVPIFGYEYKIPSRCKTHILDGMYDVVNQKCETPGCITQPSFSFEGELAIRCHAHKLDGMIDVRSRRCKFQGCTIQPSYGIEGHQPSRCKSHLINGMINVRSKRCIFQGCTITPIFGFIGKTPTHCKSHKDHNMIDLEHDTCREKDCTRRATFSTGNYPLTHCKTHKSNDMIRVDVRRCKTARCTVQPSYCKLFSKNNEHCVEHATLNEYSERKRTPKCLHVNCDELAYNCDFDNVDIYPVRCNIHKLATDITLVKQQCFNCCDILFFPENMLYCMQCGCYREKRLYHFKESIVKSFLSSNCYSFTHDKVVPNSRSGFRPDFLLKCSVGYIVIEVDEWQHKRGYTKHSETGRMCAIFNDLRQNDNNCKVLFIRYNPDHYDGVQCTSKTRLEYLNILLLHFINVTTSDYHLGVLYLYYDGFDGTPKIEKVIGQQTN